MLFVLATNHTSVAVTGEALAWIAGIIVSLGIIGRGARFMWRFGRKIHHLADWVEKIYEEFQPNHGKSFKDVMWRVDSNTQINSRNIQKVFGVIGGELDYSEVELEDLVPGPE